jgi:regulator of protease activity HflC (stomatin/prohibitin superfamily)
MLKGSLNVISLLVVTATVALVVILGALVGFGGASWLLLLAGGVVAASPRQIDQWERGVLLRLGRFRGVLQPGVVWVVPGVDRITAKVDMRIRSTSISAEKTLTQDTVPVDVDAVLFWVVTDAERALLEIQDFVSTVIWAAQAALRDVIGQAELGRMISDRQSLDQELQSIIDAKTSEWGITVQSVEIRDVRIPRDLEDSMSRKAQADREKEARVILAQSELLVAEQMEKASVVYANNPAALQLRAMNMTYESIKEQTTLLVLPSSLASSMDAVAVAMAASAVGQVAEAAESAVVK